ncbi:uncharacterized protein [Haliotis asinina]|uniref:uncharacterized protein n=1 Tax=Haliotis asinina TaxID=109174 RepID=UPI003531AF4A
MVVFSHYQGTVMRSLYLFYQESYMCDMTLIARDGEMKVHSLVLAAGSESFKAQISRNRNSRILWLSDLALREVEVVVKVIYTGELHPQDTNTTNLKILKDWKVISEDEMNAVDHSEDSAIHLSGQTNINMYAGIESDDAKEEYVLIDSQTEKKYLAATLQDQTISDVRFNRSNEPQQVTRTTNDCPHSSNLCQVIGKENVTVGIQSMPSVLVTDTISENNGEFDLHRINVQERKTIEFGIAKLCDTSEVDSEQKSVVDSVNLESNSVYRKLTDDGELDYRNVDIVQEAYKTAMSLVPTDSDGATSADSQEGQVTSAVTVSTSVDPITNINTDVDDSCGIVMDDAPRDDIDRSGNGKVGNVEEEGVVSGLRSRSGKRLSKIWKSLDTDNHECLEMEEKRGKRIQNSKRKGKEGKVKSSSASSVGCKAYSRVGQCEVLEKGRHTWYGCPECGHQFKSLKLVAGHRYSKHNVAFDPSQFQVLKCPDCDYETLEVHRLESHRATSHSSMRPYVCEWCGKDFKLLGSLTLHTNTHTRARRFQCPLCDKVFSQHGARKRHVEEKHRKSHPHLCDVCPFSTLDRVTLVQHKYTKHSTPLPPGYTIYRCPEAGCKFETFRRQVFTGHVNTHKGIQTYTCDVCQKKFSTAGNLRSHRIVHKEKSLKCPYSGCDFATRLKNRLDQHVKLMHTHRDSKPHVCPHCPYKTAIKGNLLKHQRNVHRPRHPSLAHSKGNNSDSKGDNPVAQQSISSTTVLKSLLYSSGPIQLLDVTSHDLSHGEIIVSGISPQTQSPRADSVILDIQQP